MTTMKPPRSVLYVPAANAKAMAKAETLDCDAVILDLEDAVAPGAKLEARTALLLHFEQNPSSQRVRIIRINAPSTQWGAEDLDAAVSCGPDAILLPKVESGGQIAACRAALNAKGRPDIAIWAMIETPMGIVNIREIAALGRDPETSLACLVAGTNDLARETGLGLRDGRQTMMQWLAPVVIHARASGIAVVDGVYNDFRDLDGFGLECRDAVRLGFDGKTLIHPSQLSVANAIFSPSAAAVEEARGIVAAFALPENAGKGVLQTDGRMIELLHLEMARKTLARAQAEGF